MSANSILDIPGLLGVGESPPSPIPCMGDKRRRSTPTCPSSSSSSPPPRKQQRILEACFRGLTEQCAKSVVAILGCALSETRQQLSAELETDEASASAKLFLQRFKGQEIATAAVCALNGNGDAVQLFCLLTSCMTTCLVFLDTVLHDMHPQCTLEHYLTRFHPNDDAVFGDHPSLFTWHYREVVRGLRSTVDIRQRLVEAGIQFSTLEFVDMILSQFYTTCFLEIEAQKHQKDHGQFYTPQSVVHYMWDMCPPPHASSSVFDPCMGTGAFLCEYLIRLAALHETSSVDTLLTLFTQRIPNQVWGVDIDPFALELGKLNVMIHLFPFYKRLLQLRQPVAPRSVGRLRLFCNDTLQLALTGDAWEQAQLARLRDPTSLRFDFIVTNPPYQIRKTGFVTMPDPQMYDERILGGRGMHCYLYFMWICLQRCDPHTGQVCLITPSQWVVLEFAEQLRLWLSKHCRMLEMYQFDTYKVWPKVQTDSLIFRLELKSKVPTTDGTLYLRHHDRKLRLEDLLREYATFNRAHPRDTNAEYRITPFEDQADLLVRVPGASMAFLSPSSTVSESIRILTESLPRLCDADTRPGRTASSDAPLVFHRGPNTHPVYALVVRAEWALRVLGQETCARWLRPVFYWNGKSGAVEHKEGAFWQTRDPLRIVRKEGSPAEAYVAAESAVQYLMILVDKDGADTLPVDSPLYHYLRDAREALQSHHTDRKLAYCQYNKCGVDAPAKFVHPINNGYLTKSQPRQRFFLDRQRWCVTNQCVYFTLKDSGSEDEVAEAREHFFLGLLNSSTLLFLIQENCSYDQQGRTRLFGKQLANIPYAPPSPDDVRAMHTLVRQVITVRTTLFRVLRATPLAFLHDKVRNCTWRMTEAECDATCAYAQKDTVDWIHLGLPACADVCACLVQLLWANSLYQYAIDQLVYCLYKIPPDVQRTLEAELHLTLAVDWQPYDVPHHVWDDRVAWSQAIIEKAQRPI
ncbi:hypothetical protein BCR43DRAFT_495751 [Syncephalastrum racemosum]|uniref:site-specific DNA-methyltransferase (adenine-specific) n=1 Tax=Syncephalastrum racemosum TaxID=13706 RepID=A0A1X2H6D3_SYNRA|nr:hypothetical protein BCR43DRAFT_495751 [Syncephalastrum racemosum]